MLDLRTTISSRAGGSRVAAARTWAACPRRPRALAERTLEQRGLRDLDAHRAPAAPHPRRPRSARAVGLAATRALLAGAHRYVALSAARRGHLPALRAARVRRAARAHARIRPRAAAHLPDDGEGLPARSRRRVEWRHPLRAGRLARRRADLDGHLRARAGARARGRCARPGPHGQGRRRGLHPRCGPRP